MIEICSNLITVQAGNFPELFFCQEPEDYSTTAVR